MRVLHAANFGGTTAGGFIPLIVTLAGRLRARGDAFALVVPRVEATTWYPLVRESGAELHVVGSGAEAARVTAAWKPDVAHVHFYGWELPLTLALWNAKTRLFWHAHSVFRWDRPARPSARTLIKYRLVGARVERFVTVSSALGNELAQVGAPRRRIVTVHNAVDPGRFRPPTTHERVAARAAFGIRDEPVILFFGRDPRLKGADVLAAALSRIPVTTVVTVSTPPEARDALAASARIIALDRVDDVVPLCWAADAVAMPSRGEGFPFVLLEAALTGVPVVASDIPALREAGAGYRHVRYFPTGDHFALGAGLWEALLAGRADRVECGESLATWADRIAALYDRPA